MRRLLTILLTGFWVASCTTNAPPAVPHVIQYSDRKDFVGNRLPVECLDVSDMVGKVPFTYLSGTDFKLLFPELPGRVVLGEWLSPELQMGGRSRYGHIYLNADHVTPQTEPLVMWHELCHAKMYKLYGSGWWHQ